VDDFNKDSPMPPEENKTFIRQFLEAVWNQGNLAVADEVIASPILRGAMKHAILLFRTLFPDLRFTVEDLIAEADQVVARCSLQGTFTRRWLVLIHRNETHG
jgi:predicted ester cyclase